MRARKLLEAILEEEVDIEGIASNFVESEVGMYDFIKNWEVYKAKPDLLGRVQRWLDEVLVDEVSPDQLVEEVDKLTRRGGWIASFLT